MVDDATRFWSQVNKGPGEDDCWLWTGWAGEYGHGKFPTRKPYKIWSAYRWSYEQMVGPIPEGLELDHLCRTGACVRPDHLEPVTPQENNRRSNSATAQRARQTHCTHGHPLEGDNLKIRSNGNRICRACHRQRDLEYHQRKSEAKPPKPARTHCKYGHPWVAENLLPKGRWFQCRTCNNERQRAQTARLAAERPERELATHCGKGHPMSGDNLYVHDGHRYCRACRNQRREEWRIRDQAVRDQP